MSRKLAVFTLSASIALVAGLVVALTATATPTLVTVRIEGRNETLFEGPIWTEPHYVQASSDSTERRCDGINVNDPWNTQPGPTPTAASADAMELIGETFDGDWYPGYEDYFVTRWGPDAEAEGMSWGVLVNNVFTSVGGCQYELRDGDEVLWAYNAFQSRPILALLPTSAGYTSGPRPLTVDAKLGQPFEVEVLHYADMSEDKPPPTPTRSGASPLESALVAPVDTSATGFERLRVSSTEAVSTNSQGRASITFAQPGWHRIKATVLDGKGHEAAIRSNRLDVCVSSSGSEACPQTPPEDEPRAVARTLEQLEAEAAAKQREEQEAQTRQRKQREIEETAQREERERLEAQSRIATTAGPTTTSAMGTPTPAPSTSTTNAIRWSVLRDDRWSGLRYSGGCRRASSSNALHKTVTVCRAKGEARARVGAGKAAFVLDDESSTARVELDANGRHQRLEITRGGSVTLATGKRTKPGMVSLRVLKGTIDVDAIGIER